ncbi:MAG: TIGR02444 family protein [Alphaproteobacteria bacterium]|nr:TIGR02444 family protein [Alphaproteobacteria bacterium]
MPVEFDDHPFWDFSLAVYGTAGVPPACLELQERHGIDVNVMLFCTWTGASGRGAMSEAELRSALDAVAEWNSVVVCGMRAIRRRMKEGMPPVPVERSEALRKVLMKLEVDCEHAEQLALAGAVERPTDETMDVGRRAADAVGNIAAYFALRGVRTDEADAANLATILAPALPGMDGETLRAIWRSAAA